MDGTTFCNLCPCDFDTFLTGNTPGPGDLPASIDVSGFDITGDGTGIIDITLATNATLIRTVDVFLDHEFTDVNLSFDEVGAALVSYAVLLLAH